MNKKRERNWLEQMFATLGTHITRGWNFVDCLILVSLLMVILEDVAVLANRGIAKDAEVVAWAVSYLASTPHKEALVVLMAVKVYKYVEHVPQLNTLPSVAKRAFADIFAFLTVFAVLLLAFAEVIYLNFSDRLEFHT